MLAITIRVSTSIAIGTAGFSHASVSVVFVIGIVERNAIAPRRRERLRVTVTRSASSF
jgi:hypothetical protein